MDLLEALRLLENQLGETRLEIADMQQLLDGLRQDEKRLERELVGLRSAAQRLALAPAADDEGVVVALSPDIEVPASGPVANFAVLSRSDAVIEAMRLADQPIDRMTLGEILFDHQRVDSPDQISLTLSGLKRQGRVKKLGGGLWSLAEVETLAANR